MKYTVEVDPLHMYIRGSLSCDSSPKYKKCCRVFAHRYTLVDDSEYPLDYELSLLLEVYPVNESENNERYEIKPRSMFVQISE